MRGGRPSGRSIAQKKKTETFLPESVSVLHCQIPLTFLAATDPSVITSLRRVSSILFVSLECLPVLALSRVGNCP